LQSATLVPHQYLPVVTPPNPECVKLNHFHGGGSIAFGFSNNVRPISKLAWLGMIFLQVFAKSSDPERAYIVSFSNPAINDEKGCHLSLDTM
jgi:hypothetical protein